MTTKKLRALTAAVISLLLPLFAACGKDSDNSVDIADEEDESIITPIRERDTVLHVRRRRWKDASGKSYARDIQLTAKGTRISMEFAAFLKEALGLEPSDSPFA